MRVAEQAAAWFARHETGPLSSAENLEFRAWLARDPEHVREYEAVERMWSTYDRVTPPSLDPQPARRQVVSRPRRFRVALGSALAAAACLVAVLLGLAYNIRWRADMFTGVGEMRTVSLPDGSAVLLNTDSAIKLRFTRDQRVVELLGGEADFRVARDPQRPFIVEAAGGSTRALGTEFMVRREEAGATVTLLEHEVLVAYVESAGRPAEHVTLSPGDRVTYGPDTGLQSVQSVKLDRVASWRRGWLSFEDRPLGEVVDELQRYVPGWIRISDPALRNVRVTCAIPLDRPAAGIDHLARSLGLHTSRLTDYLILIRE